MQYTHVERIVTDYIFFTEHQCSTLSDEVRETLNQKKFREMFQFSQNYVSSIIFSSK